MIKGTTRPLEIPKEMQTVAEQGVEQAKLAFNNYMQAAQEAVSTFEHGSRRARSARRASPRRP